MRLEYSIWHRYHPETSLHDGLVHFYGCDGEAVSMDDDYLYALIKQKLTKKELRFFIMDEAKAEPALIEEALHVTHEELDALRRKAYRKLRDGKTRKAMALGPILTATEDGDKA